MESDVDGLTIVNGISANRYRIADSGEAERRIGYQPVDDAWEQAQAFARGRASRYAQKGALLSAYTGLDGDCLTPARGSW
jgi:hypothetical protein